MAVTYGHRACTINTSREACILIEHNDGTEDGTIELLQLVRFVRRSVAVPFGNVQMTLSVCDLLQAKQAVIEIYAASLRYLHK